MVRASIPNDVFAFHDKEEIGPKLPSRMVRHAGLKPEIRETSQGAVAEGSRLQECIFGLCGVRDFTRRAFGSVVTSVAALRRGCLQEAADIVARVFPLRHPPESSSW